MALSDEGRARVAEVAARHGVSAGTAERLAEALSRGGGSQAQFNESELGGFGQWSRGGMIMIGDMFNSGLKARVDALCSELSGMVGAPGMFATEASGSGFGGGDSWPADLGHASTSGAQNDMRYAVFPDRRRLAVARGGTVTIYDTGDHAIGGVSQQQSGDQSLSFTSQFGPVRLTDLPVVSGEGSATPSSGSSAAAAPAAAPADGPAASRASPPATTPAFEPSAGPVADAGRDAPGKAAPTTSGPGAGADVLATIEKLADLHGRGILTAEEFAKKKAELLDRL